MVLDLMLPKLDGIQICRALRAEPDVAIIMLTVVGIIAYVFVVIAERRVLHYLPKRIVDTLEV